MRTALARCMVFVVQGSDHAVTNCASNYAIMIYHYVRIAKIDTHFRKWIQMVAKSTVCAAPWHC